MTPVVLPAVGVEVHDVNLEPVPFGASGVMVNIDCYFVKLSTEANSVFLPGSYIH